MTAHAPQVLVALAGVAVLVGVIAARTHALLVGSAVRRRVRGGQLRGARRASVANVLHRYGRRHRREIAVELAQMLDGIARRCAGGDSLASAFSAVQTSSTTAEFAASFAALEGGASIIEALDLARHRASDPDAILAAHVLSLCAGNGGPVSEALDRAASTLRERHAISRERIAQSAQARLSAHVLTALPVLFAAWSISTSTLVRATLATPIGVGSLCAGLALNITGWKVMHRLIGDAR